jgi:TonB family protein
MNRLQKKCIIVSAGIHLLLAIMLLFGPGFLSSGDNSPVIKPIDFVPTKVVEDAISGGGNPNANPLPPEPPAPQPPAVVTAPAVQQVQIEQPKDVPKPPLVKIVEKPVPAPVTKPEKHLPDVSTALVTSKPTTKPTAKPSSTAKDAERKRAAEQFARAAAGLRNNLAPTTSLELRGPGGGGETYAGVQQTVLSTYDRVWISPEGMDTSEAVVEVKVTIESDGTVSSASITKRSGDARVDQSVQRALDRVTSIHGWDGKRRTVEFSFKSRAKENV